MIDVYFYKDGSVEAIREPHPVSDEHAGSVHRTNLAEIVLRIDETSLEAKVLKSRSYPVAHKQANLTSVGSIFENLNPNC